MKPNFKTEAFSSYMMWFDHKISNNAEAYVNKSNAKLYPQIDGQLDSSLISFAAETKSWVFDKSVTGAFQAKTALVFSETGVQLSVDKIIDYSNSRVLFYKNSAGNLTDKNGVEYNNSGIPINLSTNKYITISACAIKELNIYDSNESQEDLIIERMLGADGEDEWESKESREKPVAPYDLAVPCAILSIPQANNSPYAIGGEDLYKMKARAVVITREKYELDVILGTFEDLNKTCMPVLSFEDLPLNTYGDLMVDYDYKNLETIKTKKIFVDDVFSSKTRDVVRKKVNPSFYIGFLDFDLSISRYPRA